MKFSKPLQPGKILKRYKRFLADLELPCGRQITAHTPNTGSMATCWEKGWDVLYSESPNKERKYPATLEMTHNGKTWIGVNTGLPNFLVEESLRNNKIPEIQGYSEILREKKVGDSRLDLFLQDKTGSLPDCYIEVKNVTLWSEGDYGLFPDAVSERGAKHLQVLIDLKKRGFRSMMFYVVQRQDVRFFSPAHLIDPGYAQTLSRAREEGVEILVYRCRLSPTEICLEKKLPFHLKNGGHA